MIPEYHPYTLPYNTKPGLYKLGHDFGNGYMDCMVFQTDDNYEDYQKRKITEVNHKNWTINRKYEKEICVVKDFINQELVRCYPNTFKQPDFAYLFSQDDFTIHRIEDGSDKLIYANVYFPSLWKVEDSLGASLKQFHEPVPDIVFPDKLLQTVLNGRFQRFVWSLFYNQRLNQHPDLPLETFNLKNPIWHIRVERQVTIGFPEINCFLFVVKPYIVKNPKIPELIKTIDGMTDEHRRYKRITPEFVNYLKESL